MPFENQNGLNPGNLSLERLPPELMEKVLEALAYPVIPLCPDGQQLGSGVLVEVDGVSGILTAEHVIFDRRFQTATGLWTTPHLHSQETRDKPTTHFTSTNIRMDYIRCYPETPQLDEANPEWGPDLAFIRIPELTNFEKSLRAVRNFYGVARDLDDRKQRALHGNDTILAVIGTPGGTSQVSLTLTDIRGIVQLTAFLAADFEPKTRGDYDYFDVPVDYESVVKLPKSFVGVSGGAVCRRAWYHQRGVEPGVAKFLRMSHLSPAFGLKSPEARRAYQKCHYGRLRAGPERTPHAWLLPPLARCPGSSGSHGALAIVAGGVVKTSTSPAL